MVNTHSFSAKLSSLLLMVIISPLSKVAQSSWENSKSHDVLSFWIFTSICPPTPETDVPVLHDLSSERWSSQQACSVCDHAETEMLGQDEDNWVLGAASGTWGCTIRLSEPLQSLWTSSTIVIHRDGYCLADTCQHVKGHLEHLLLHCPALQIARHNLQRMRLARATACLCGWYPVSTTSQKNGLYPWSFLCEWDFWALPDMWNASFGNCILYVQDICLWVA